jgi:hypothetical protein
MRRSLFTLLLTLMVFLLPTALARAAAVPGIQDRMLVITGDAAPDRIELSSTPGALLVNGVAFSRAAFDRVAIDGGGGADTVKLTGEGDSEEFTVQAADGGVRISRDTDGLRVDMTGVEAAELDAAGGPDLIDVGDLDGRLDRLRAGLGAADGARDSVSVQGTGGHDSVSVSSALGLARVSGLDTIVEVADASPADDRLDVQTFGGPDTLGAVGSVGSLVGLTLDGGDGDDVLNGATAAETLRGGAGNDTVRGRQGADDIALGEGADTMDWGFGDGDDRVEGDGGSDRVQIPGSSADERFDITANGPRVEVLRSTGGQLSAGGVETFEPTPSTGTDTVHVGDLTPTGAQQVSVDLGGPDQHLDSVIADGTPAADKIKLASNGHVHTIGGLGAQVVVTESDPGQKLVVDGLAGDDTIDASELAKDVTQPFIGGGPGKDLIVGSPGQDVIAGGPDADVALLSGGLDTFNWAAGDGNDIVEGGAGTDFLNLNGSGADERFDVSAVGGRTRVTRDVGNVNLDLGDVERFDIAPLGGADTMHVGDLSGTDTDHVTLRLTPFRTTLAPDGAPDRVVVDGTNGSDTVQAGAGGPEVFLTGLFTRVETIGSEPALDSFFLDTKLGTDSVAVDPHVLQLIAFGFV